MLLGPAPTFGPYKVIPMFYPMVKCGNAVTYTFPHCGDPPERGRQGKALPF